MPMMLENTMSMEMDEDLFGEGADVMGPDVMGTDVMGTLMPMRAQNKHLRQRLDDMRSRGCCQTIAWSRTGTIASISSDGTRLQLRQLRAHPKDGSWDLSEPTTSTHVQGTPSNPLVHLEWAATNSPELAVFDSVGRVMLFSFALALNHPFVLRNWDADPIDTLNAAVGCYCLPVPPPSPQKPFNILHGPAVKTNTGYQYTSSFVHLNTVSHPHPSKTALFSVTAGGMLRMFWGQSNNTYQETTKELESVHSSEDLITHAAITADKSNLLIAVATSSKRLRLHKVDIQWGNTNPQGDKPATTPQIPRLNPSLHNKQLATTSWTQSGPSSMSADPSMTELSSLTVLPSSLDSSGSNTAPAVVVAIRSSLPGPGVFGDGQSVLDRWEVVEQRETLHPAFEQLGSRRNSISSNELPMVTKLRKLEPIVLPKILIRLQTMHFGRTLILNYSDGSVEYRNRFTFEELYVEEDLNHVAHLRQVGWAFPEGTSCYQVAYSPTFSSMIVIGDDAKPRWVKMQYTKGDIGETMQDPTYGACIAGLTVTAASAMWYQSNVDDLLALASSYTHKKRFNMDWVGDLVRILKVQVDYTDVDQPHDNLIRNTVLQGCLSIVHSTGFRGRLKKQSFSGKMAMINLNVRNVNLLITFALNSPPPLRERTNPLDEDEVVVILSDCARWALDLLAWLADCLFELMHDEYFMKLVEQQKSPDMMQYLMGRNDISLHLVLCSSSRSLLSALCRRMGNVESISNKAHEHYQQQRASGTARSSNLQLQEAYAKMKRTTSSAMINIKAMEKLLHTFATDIKQTYADFLPKLMKNQPNPPQGKEIDGRVRSAQSQCELAMLSCSPPPVPFFTVIRKFFETDLRAFRNEVDAAGLYFANYDILEVQDDDSSLAAKGTRGTHVDVFKRVELGPTPRQGKQWRRCTRCSAVMEDVPGQRSNLAGLTFLLNQQRKCSCGGFWTLLPPGKLVL